MTHWGHDHHQHHHHGHHDHHQRFTCVMLIIDVHLRRHQRRRYITFLTANRRTILSNVIVTVGHTVTFSLVFLDQNGNPMVTTPLPDAPPTWTDTTPATGTLTPAASGLTATELTTGVGADTVNVSLAVGGTSFSASIDLTVQDVPQVLTSVQIAATVV
jgi:hypothetical protein